MLHLLAPLLYIVLAWFFWHYWGRSVFTTGVALGASGLVSWWISCLPPADTPQQTYFLLSIISGTLLLLIAVIFSPTKGSMELLLTLALLAIFMIGSCLDTLALSFWDNSRAAELRNTYFFGATFGLMLVSFLWVVLDLHWTHPRTLSGKI